MNDRFEEGQHLYFYQLWSIIFIGFKYRYIKYLMNAYSFLWIRNMNKLNTYPIYNPGCIFLLVELPDINECGGMAIYILSVITA